MRTQAALTKASAEGRVKVTDLTAVCDDPTAEGVPANVLAVSPCKVS